MIALFFQKLVIKPDQLVKRRGKLGLVGINKDEHTVKQWFDDKLNTKVQVGETQGVLKKFIIEPMVPHKQVCYNELYRYMSMLYS